MQTSTYSRGGRGGRGGHGGRGGRGGGYGSISGHNKHYYSQPREEGRTYREDYKRGNQNEYSPKRSTRQKMDEDHDDNDFDCGELLPASEMLKHIDNVASSGEIERRKAEKERLFAEKRAVAKHNLEISTEALYEDLKWRITNQIKNLCNNGYTEATFDCGFYYDNPFPYPEGTDTQFVGQKRGFKYTSLLFGFLTKPSKRNKILQFTNDIEENDNILHSMFNTKPLEEFGLVPVWTRIKREFRELGYILTDETDTFRGTRFHVKYQLAPDVYANLDSPTSSYYNSVGDNNNNDDDEEEDGEVGPEEEPMQISYAGVVKSKAKPKSTPEPVPVPEEPKSILGTGAIAMDIVQSWGGLDDTADEKSSSDDEVGKDESFN